MKQLIYRTRAAGLGNFDQGEPFGAHFNFFQSFYTPDVSRTRSCFLHCLETLFVSNTVVATLFGNIVYIVC